MNHNHSSNQANDLGLIHIYCGDGKGKTTAASGLALRMAGANFRVLIARFLKNDDSSELNILNTLPGIDVIQTPKDFGFIWNMSDVEKIEAGNYYSQLLINSMNTASEQDYNMLILDEINVAVDLDFVKEELLLQIINQKPKNLELVLTGRNPKPSILEVADYVSDIHCVKHPFEKGISSRTGIED